jgi:ferredoxin
VPKVSFLVTGGAPKSIDVLPRATLLRAVVRARLPIGRSCRGVGICAACRVFVVEGEQHVEPMDEIEALAEHERYACRARIAGVVTITTAYW